MILGGTVGTPAESPGSNAAGYEVTDALEDHKQCPRGVRLGATLGATRMNNLGML
jgi:hypothetical protein